MPSKITAEQYVKIFNELDVNNEYELLSQYKGSREYIKVLHKSCGHIWEVQAGGITNKKRGPRCPMCGRKIAGNSIHKAKAYTTQSFIDYVRKVSGDEYSVKGTYYNSKTPIEVVHNTCMNRYKVSPSDFKSGKRCPKCAIKRRAKKTAKTTAKFSKEVQLLGSGDYQLMSEYKNWKTKVKILHKVCGRCYFVEPNSFIQGERCPGCKTSHGENFIKKYLDDNYIIYEQQVKFMNLKDKRCLSYDFYLPNEDILIEYQGKQHYVPVERYGGNEHLKVQQYHDILKYKYAYDNQIRLIEVNYVYNSYGKVKKFLDSII